MKKLYQLTLFILGGLILLPSQIMQAAPAPSRPAIPYQQHVTQGLPYPSFNNFTGNPNISTSGGDNLRNGDERNLLTGVNCKTGACNAEGITWEDNSLSSPVQKGDKIRFEIYYHNNGDDPYNSDSQTSPNAQNVEIGVRLNQTNSTTIQAVGSIYASNNEYRTNPNNSTTIIKDSSGNIIRTATDDMQIRLASENLELKFVPTTHYLYTLLNKSTTPQTYYDNYITNNNTPITYRTDIQTNFTTNISPFTSSDGKYAALRFSEVPGCFRYSGFVQFDAIVTEKPPVVEPTPNCTGSSLSITKRGTNQTVTCLNGEEYTLKSTSTFNNVPNGTAMRIEWSTTDQNGRFLSNNSRTYIQNANVGTPIQTDYRGAGIVTMKVLDVNGKVISNQQSCTKNTTLCPIPEPPTCVNSSIKAVKFNPTTHNFKEDAPCLAGETYILTFTSNFTNTSNNTNVRVQWSTTDPDGIFYESPTQNIPTSNNSVTTNITYKGKGVVEAKVISVNGQTLATGHTCTKSLNSCELPPELICQNLQVYNTYPSGQTILNSPLKPQTLYKLHNTTLYTPQRPTNPTTSYTSTEGIFFPASTPISVVTGLVDTMKNGTPFTKAQAQTNGQSFTATVNDGDSVFFLTLTDSTNIGTPLAVKANNTNVLACQKAYTLTNTPCQNLRVNVNDNNFTITGGNFGDFTGTIRATSICNSTTVTEEYKVKDLPVVINKNPKNCSLTVKAIGPNAGNNCEFTHIPLPEETPICKDLQISSPSGKWNGNETTFRLNVTSEPSGYAQTFTYLWEGNNVDITNSRTSNLTNNIKVRNKDRNASVTVTVQGSDNFACRATKTYEPDDEDDDRKENPEISKKVYDVKNNRWTDLINIGGKQNNQSSWLNRSHQYVTYLATVETGTARSIEVKENSLSQNRIKAKESDGNFDLKSLIIAVDGTNGREVIYRSSDFSTARFNDHNIYNSHKLSQFQNHSRSESYFKDQFACQSQDDENNNSSNNKVCIEDFESIFQDFGSGRAIKINNTRNINHVFFIYQMENNTVITDRYCQTQAQRVGYCGETFDNTAQVTGYEKVDFETRYATASDNAQAIAMCSFILTRQSGDAFFKTPLKVGIDISQCYQVENCEGPCIIDDPKDDPYIPKTGAGEEELVLQAPTHDICKFSNTSDNISGYKNELENFSSAICELKIAVAKEWQESTINKTLSASIERLARNNTATGNHTIKTVDDLRRINGTSNSGVVVIDGNLTIDGNGGTYTITSSSNLPAAQTYIVKNGNLTIKSNIKYAQSGGLTQLIAPRTIPSAAFVVLDGNIIIDNNVTQLDGIYMALDTKDPKDKGQITTSPNEPTYENTLTINGSLIGDVYNLFSNRRAIGDPLKDQGAITIRYDQRILLNTPPGLSTLLDISQLRVAR